MTTKEAIFDTRVDTKKMFVSLKTKFRKRNYVNKDGKSLIYLVVSSGKKRERINMDIFVDAKKWDDKAQRLKEVTPHDCDMNLILDSVEKKITSIKIVYRLSEMLLTPKLLRKELMEGMERVNFVSYFEKSIKNDESFLRAGTYRRYISVMEKMKKWRSEIFFNQIDYKLIDDYRRYMKGLGNKQTTINSNIKVIKTYLRAAKKDGIKIKIDIEQIHTGTTRGNRTSLNPEELKKLVNQYFNSYNTPGRKLVLGYFLFSCFTGLRLSDVMALERKDIKGELSFVSVKTQKDQIISLNNKAVEIIKHCEDLFVVKPHPNTLNKELRTIAVYLGLSKNISFHVARHTFATTFLRMGGKVEKLQVLLGHSKIETTMIYVHILAEEANKEVFLLDKLFE